MKEIGLIGRLRQAGGNGTVIHAFDPGADDDGRLRETDMAISEWCCTENATFRRWSPVFLRKIGDGTLSRAEAEPYA